MCSMSKKIMHAFRNKLYQCGTLLLLSTGAFGQDANPEDIIAGCARIAAVGDRILCLEAAIRTLNVGDHTSDRSLSLDESVRKSSDDNAMPAPAQPQTAAPLTHPRMTEEEAPRISASGAELAQAATDEKSIPEETPTAVAAPLAMPPAVGQTTTGIVVASEKPPAELGAEQVARIQGTDNVLEKISARIVAVELVGSGRMRFTLDNGQLWQQTGDDDQRIFRRIRGEDSVDVEMWQAKTGGYRLHILDIDRTVRVRRLR